jgi:hypothetical protein
MKFPWTKYWVWFNTFLVPTLQLWNFSNNQIWQVILIWFVLSTNYCLSFFCRPIIRVGNRWIFVEKSRFARASMALTERRGWMTHDLNQVWERREFMPTFKRPFKCPTQIEQKYALTNFLWLWRHSKAHFQQFYFIVTSYKIKIIFYCDFICTCLNRCYWFVTSFIQSIRKICLNW